MLNEIIPGLSKSSKTWQCRHRGAVPSREMFYLWIFLWCFSCVFRSAPGWVQLRAKWGLGNAQKVLLELAVHWENSKFSSSRVWKLFLSPRRARMVTLPSLARVPSGIHALGSATSSEQSLNPRVQEEQGSQPEVLTGPRWNYFGFCSLRAAHPAEPPALLQQEQHPVSLPSFLNMDLCFWSTPDALFSPPFYIKNELLL